MGTKAWSKKNIGMVVMTGCAEMAPHISTNCRKLAPINKKWCVIAGQVVQGLHS